MSIAEGLNWAIISQAHAFSDIHWDTAGAWTAVAILHGIKFWAVRKTPPSGSALGFDMVDYWVNLAEHDLDSLPGGRSA
ncbi:hypothetical protein, partial [Escherichia coli]|uniref:hypothetical protein n=1 Tax=Escherichia coli TaxID=562 RepID=UPI001F4A13CF